MGSETGIKGYVVRGTDSEGEAVRDDCADLASAIHTWRDWNRCTLSILAVAKDGTQTPLPSYEEALAHLAAVREALAITPGETATGAAQRTAVALAQAREEIERLRGLIGAFPRKVSVKANVDRWCSLVAEFPAFEALQQEPKGRVS